MPLQTPDAQILDVIVPGGSRLGLLIGLLGVPLAGLVMADNASGNDADLAVACHMARDAADHGAFDATIRGVAIGSAAVRDNPQSATGKDNGRRICNMTVTRGREMDDGW
jgi:hypothetical protein